MRISIFTQLARQFWIAEQRHYLRNGNHTQARTARLVDDLTARRIPLDPRLVQLLIDGADTPEQVDPDPADISVALPRGREHLSFCGCPVLTIETFGHVCVRLAVADDRQGLDRGPRPLVLDYELIPVYTPTDFRRRWCDLTAEHDGTVLVRRFFCDDYETLTGVAIHDEDGWVWSLTGDDDEPGTSPIAWGEAGDFQAVVNAVSCAYVDLLLTTDGSPAVRLPAHA